MINLRIGIFWISFFLLLLTIFVHALKVTRISYDVAAIFFYVYFVFLTFMYFFGLLFFSSKSFFSGVGLFFLSLSGYSLILLCFGLSGDLFSVLGDFLRFVFVVSVYGYFSSVGLEYVCDEGRIKNISILSVACVAVPLVGIYFVSSHGGSVYFGLQSTLALLGVAFGLVYKRYLLLIFSLIIILLSGKRGVMVSSIFVVFFFFLIEASMYRVRAVVGACFFLFFSIFILVVFDMVPEPIVTRIGYLTGDTIDIRMATAGRNEEIEYVVDILSNNPYAFWFGSGLGAGFVNDLGNFKSTVHFSPAGLVLKYGFFWMLAFYVMISVQLIRGLMWVKIMAADGRNYQFWLLVFVGEFVFSFSAYTLFQSLIFWVAFAVLAHPRRVVAFNLSRSG